MSEPAGKLMTFRGNGRPKLSAGIKKDVPPGWEPARWKKHRDNVRRAEAYTGLMPIAAESWEGIAVALMDALDRVNKGRKHKVRAVYQLVKIRKLEKSHA